MSGVAVALIAWSGTYLFVALFYRRLRRIEPRREYGLFSMLTACLAVFSFSTAISIDASSPAAAYPWQVLQHLALVPGAAYFTELCLCLADERYPRLSRAVRAWKVLAVGVFAAGLGLDPSLPDAAYGWGPPTAFASATASLRPIGALALVFGVAAAVFATARLVNKARDRRDLRVAAFITALLVAGGAVHLGLRIFGHGAIALMSHGALMTVLGISYVLLGRLTQVDAQLEDRTQQLAESYHDLRAAQEELVRAEQLAAVGELSAVIAHEVRNPLAIIKNAVSGLRRRELAPRDAETLLVILDDETDRLNRLVRDFLAYAKPISLEAESVDLRSLVLRAVELAAAGSHGIKHVELELDLALDRELPTVEGDATLLRHALINIVDNALQAMPAGGTLTVSCRDALLDGRPSLAVDFHDTGEGMDTLVRQRARDPFFTTREESTGLGLAIVERVAKVHGGRVEIESRHGQGTTVSLVVPLERSSTVPPPA